MKLLLPLMLFIMAIPCQGRERDRQARAEADTLMIREREEDWEQYLTELYENEEEAAVSMEEAYENLSALAQQPLNINTATQEDLMAIPGLTAYQINDIMQYIHRNGDMRTIEELAMIPSIDHRERLYLSCFLTARHRDDIKWYSKEGRRNIMKNIHHEVDITIQTPTYYRAGDINAPRKTYLGENRYAGKYLGDPTKHSVRYTLTVGENVSLHLTGGKSAAEPFGNKYNTMGYDQYAYNIDIRQMGIFQRIIIGQYKVRFGMGLIINNNFSLGKQALLSAMGRSMAAFSPYNSTSGMTHCQGIATTVNIARRMSLSAFISYHQFDATLNKDGTIATILNSGYHRTENEMAKKNNSAMFTSGAHLGYNRGRWGVGFNMVFSQLNREIIPAYTAADTIANSKRYRLYYPKGKTFWNTSVDYHWQWHDIVLAGETATGACGQIATINSLTWRSPWNITLMALQRYYAYQYSALHGSSFGENSSPQNESGIYIGMQWKMKQGITIDAYSDIAYFPWYKYRVSNSSYSWDNSLAASCNKGLWNFSMRYRIKTKQQDKTLESGEKVLVNKTDQRLRLLASYNNKKWSSRTQIEGCLLAFNSSSKGAIITQSIAYKAPRKWQIYTSAAYFNTQDYDSRLYTYERGMKYTFGNTAFYGHGVHGALLASYNIANAITTTAKISHTRYFDRTTIGTAERMIFSSYYTDIDMQIIVKW